MVKFSNEKSEALYYKLLDKFGKETLIWGRYKSKKLRFPIDPRLGVNKSLYTLAEIAEGGFRKQRLRKGTVDRINRIKSLSIEVSEIRSIVHSNTDICPKIINNFVVPSKSKEILIKEFKETVEELISLSGYLLTKQILEEELDELNKRIKMHQQKLRDADDNLRKAEDRKEQCLRILYGTTTEKEG